MLEKKACKDHLGNEYESLGEMCRAYGIIRQTYRKRINYGWSIKDALTKKVKASKRMAYTDHLGNEYATLSVMCDAYGVTRTLFASKIRRGWSVKDALTLDKQHAGSKGKICTDHFGNEYKSISKMCRSYEIDINLYYSRMSAGWDKERALTKKKKV